MVAWVGSHPTGCTLLQFKNKIYFKFQQTHFTTISPLWTQVRKAPPDAVSPPNTFLTAPTSEYPSPHNSQYTKHPLQATHPSAFAHPPQ